MSTLTPAFPTQFTTTALEDYVKQLAYILVGFGIAAIALSFILTLLKCKLRNPRKEKGARSSFSRVIIVVLGLAIVGVSIIACSVCWSYNTQNDKGFSDALGAVDGLFVGSNTMVISLNGTLLELSGDLFFQIDRAVNMTANMSSILDPILNIPVVVDEMQDQVDFLANETEKVIANVSSIRTDLVALNEQEQKGYISGVPSPSEVPNVDDSYSEQIKEAQSDMHNLTITAQNLTDNVNSSIVNISTAIEAKLKNSSSYYDSQVRNISAHIDDAQNSINSYHTTFSGISDQVKYYSHVRTVVVDVILIIPIVVAGIGAFGLLFKIRRLLVISFGLGFIFLFWFILIAGVNYVVYAVMYGFCLNETQIVTSLLNTQKMEIQIPGLNHTTNLPEKLQQLIVCTGETNLITIFELDFVINNLNQQIQDQLDYANKEKSMLNQTDQYNSMNDYIASFKNNTIDLDYGSTKNVTDVMAKLVAIQTQLNNLTSFNFSEVAYNASMAALNAQTSNMVLTNGTVLSLYYDSSNVTNLNCTTDPYDKLANTTQREEICVLSAAAIALTLEREVILDIVKDIDSNITDILGKLDGFLEIFPLVNLTQQALLNWTGNIQDDLHTAFLEANKVMATVDDVINTIGATIASGIVQVHQNTRCEFIGSAYNDISSSFCTVIRPTFQVIAAMMLLGSVALFFGCILSLFMMNNIDKTSSYDEGDA